MTLNQTVKTLLKCHKQGFGYFEESCQYGAWECSIILDYGTIVFHMSDYSGKNLQENEHYSCVFGKKVEELQGLTKKELEYLVNQQLYYNTVVEQY